MYRAYLVLLCCVLASAVASVDLFAYNGAPVTGQFVPTTYELIALNYDNSAGSGSAFLTVDVTLAGCTNDLTLVTITGGAAVLSSVTPSPTGKAVALPTVADLTVLVYYDAQGGQPGCTITVNSPPHLIPCTCTGAAPCCDCGFVPGRVGCGSVTNARCYASAITGGDPSTSMCYCDSSITCLQNSTLCDDIAFGKCKSPRQTWNTPFSFSTIQAVTLPSNPPGQLQDGASICEAHGVADLYFGEQITLGTTHLCCSNVGTLTGSSGSLTCTLNGACPTQQPGGCSATTYLYGPNGNLANKICYWNCYKGVVLQNFWAAVILPNPDPNKSAVSVDTGAFSHHRNAGRFRSSILASTLVGAQAGIKVGCDIFGKVVNSHCVPAFCGLYTTCASSTAYYFDSNNNCWSVCYLLPA